MERLGQGLLGILALLATGQCVADIPTGEELFNEMNPPRLIVPSLDL